MATRTLPVFAATPDGRFWRCVCVADECAAWKEPRRELAGQCYADGRAHQESEHRAAKAG